MDSHNTPTRPSIMGASTVAADGHFDQSRGPPGPARRRRKNHRGGEGKKRKTRRKSFAGIGRDLAQDNEGMEVARDSFYKNQNLSNTSIDSQVLLDHRDQQYPLRPRRPSIMTPNKMLQHAGRLRSGHNGPTDNGDEDDDEDGGGPWNEGAPLLSSSYNYHRVQTLANYGSNDGTWRNRPGSGRRDSSRDSKGKRYLIPFTPSGNANGYNVNYPPSVPGSPPRRPSDPMDMTLGDVMLGDHDAHSASGDGPGQTEDEIDEDASYSPTPDRRHTIALQAEGDVCFPQDMSEIADEDTRSPDRTNRPRPRRRRAKWPDFSVLEEWNRFEKEGRSEERRVLTITEPHLINGRMRTVHKGWYQSEEDAPYRFTYFNEELKSTIHSQTISELVQPGGTFRELFLPDRPLLSDSSDDEDDEPEPALHDIIGGENGDLKVPMREQPSLMAVHPAPADARKDRSFVDSRASTSSNRGSQASKLDSGTQTPADIRSPSRVLSPGRAKDAKPPPRYGDRPVWWLDVMSPTEAEMKVISKTFGIHPLTSEDIMMQEAREKVELFRHYYFVNYRTFDQDENSPSFLEAVDMYVIVFREGVLSFHFSPTPHPNNVRRRIRQLTDYLMLTSDWISYAIIDDITDAFGPLIQRIEDEVDQIDDAILALHTPGPHELPGQKDITKSESGETTDESGRDRDMLRSVGDVRKKVMSLYRLLGNKADVIKGFAKRCNERWEVAPRSDIGLYLGDIQDHIVTMTSNLSHYEKILARSHQNYLAHINIRMNERQEKTATVLGRLTVLGTIVLPMNIVTGLWGMNVWVPGQDHNGDLLWFFGITGFLLVFGAACYMIAKRVYGIV